MSLSFFTPTKFKGEKERVTYVLVSLLAICIIYNCLKWYESVHAEGEKEFPTGKR